MQDFDNELENIVQAEALPTQLQLLGDEHNDDRPKLFVSFFVKKTRVGIACFDESKSELKLGDSVAGSDEELFELIRNVKYQLRPWTIITCRVSPEALKVMKESGMFKKKTEASLMQQADPSFEFNGVRFVHACIEIRTCNGFQRNEGSRLRFCSSKKQTQLVATSRERYRFNAQVRRTWFLRNRLSFFKETD